MKISIVSSDERYKIVSRLLRENGYDAEICAPDEVNGADFVILSVRKELTIGELKQVFSQTSKETVVLCGEDDRIDKLFKGKRVIYSQNGDFLEKNAVLTAEAAVSFLHNLIKEELKGKIVFVSGYGRIGRLLCGYLKALGSHVFAYARREEVREKMLMDGICPLSLEESVNADIILNTVPFPVFSEEITNKIPKDAVIVELASAPYGFENMERVTLATGLPGKILPKGAARAVYDTIAKILSEAEKE